MTSQSRISLSKFILSTFIISPSLKNYNIAKNNKKYIIKTSLSRSSHEFVKLIKKKNNDIFIGDINEYKIQKEKIEYIKQIKERTRI